MQFLGHPTYVDGVVFHCCSFFIYFTKHVHLQVAKLYQMLDN